MSVFASLKQFDAYSKPVEDFRERTVTGEFFFKKKKQFLDQTVSSSISTIIFIQAD